MASIICKSKLYSIGDTIILPITQAASAQLPTRGQTMVTGTLNSIMFATPLEPDGNGSHFFIPSTELLQQAHAKIGDTVTISLVSTTEWIEPAVPADIETAVQANPANAALWQEITPLARWEWVRWIQSTANPETRARRIAVACSKLTAGKRRPCCWNRNLCTIPQLAKNGILLPAH